MTITSKDNEKLKLVRRLAERKHRQREGLFVTEGEDLYEAGHAAGHEPHFVLTRAGSNLGSEEVEPKLLEAVSSLGSGTRVIAIWPTPLTKRPNHPPIRGSDGRSPLVVYLHGVADPGNVGAIVRTTAALSAAAIALGPGCADPFGPKAVRASMGAIFTVPFARCELDATPAPRVALVAHGGDPEPPNAPVGTIALGSEREGLPREAVAGCDAKWTIPVREEAVESLGVAAAAAIALGRIGSRIGAEPG